MKDELQLEAVPIKIFLFESLLIPIRIPYQFTIFVNLIDIDPSRRPKFHLYLPRVMKIIDSLILINNELSNIAFGFMIDSDLVGQNDFNITVDIMKNSELIGLGKDLFKDSVNILSFHFAILVCTEYLNRELMYLVIRGVILAD